MISANPIYFIRVIYTYVSIVHVILTSLRLLFHCICEDEYDQVFLLFLSWSEVNGGKAQTKYTLKSRFTIFHNFFFLLGIRTNKDACGFGKRFYFWCLLLSTWQLVIFLTIGHQPKCRNVHPYYLYIFTGSSPEQSWRSMMWFHKHVRSKIWL